MNEQKDEGDMNKELREDLIKLLYEWGFTEYNIARAFDIHSSLVFELTKGLTPTKYGVCKDDGWLMEELMRMGITKQEVSLLFETDEVYIDSYIEKYRSREIAVAKK